MGSRNVNGTVISQSRQMIRSTGSSQTKSADRVEISSLFDGGTVLIGTNADRVTTQYDVVMIDPEILKVTTPVSDGLVERI